MSELVTASSNGVALQVAESHPLKNLFNRDDVKKKFQEMLGKKAQGFITSVLQIASSNSLLMKADPKSIYNAAATAATLDLPINQNLGFAWIVPYKGAAQFQIGWKGFVQLALRTGQYARINVVDVYQNQFKSFNALTEELDANFDIDGEGEIVGYCAHFRLVNGFEKTTYWSKAKVVAHATKYSQSYKSTTASSPWKDKDQFHEMSKKTVLKNTLAKWGIMSIEMQKAVITDQAIINDEEATDVTYADNEPANPYLIADNKERKRIIDHIEKSKTPKQLAEVASSIGDDEELNDLYNNKLISLS